jgi:hypothetical protein
MLASGPAGGQKPGIGCVGLYRFLNRRPIAGASGRGFPLIEPASPFEPYKRYQRAQRDDGEAKRVAP